MSVNPPERTDVQRDLGGNIRDLTPGDEEVLYDAGLGKKPMRLRVERRRRAAERANEQAERFSPEQQDINARGLRKASKAHIKAMDKGVDEDELRRRQIVRIARGNIEPSREPDVALSSPSKPEPSYRSSGDEPPTLFDTLPKPVDPGIEFVTAPVGPFVNLEDRAVALEALMKVLGLYNGIAHAEDRYALDTSRDGGETGRKLDGMKSKADKKMRGAWPQVDVLTAADYYKRMGYDPEEIARMRYEMIKDLKKYGASTNSEERAELVAKAQATAAIAASIRARNE